MVRCILSPTAACIAYHSPDYQPTSSLKRDLTNVATNKGNYYPDSGNKTGDQYNSH